MQNDQEDRWEAIYASRYIHQAIDTNEFNAEKNSGRAVKCPCCEKIYNQLYRRRIYGAMVQGLIRLMHGANGGIHHSSVGDFAKLEHWGLVSHDEDMGKYRITPAGIEFAMGKSRVPKYVYLRNNVLVGTSEETVDIKEAMDRHVDK